MNHILKTVAISLCIAVASLHAWGQSAVNESLESATLYVDAVYGNDSNPGTAAAPLQTLNFAVSLAIDNNQSGIGTNVIVNPGIYREALTINSNALDTSLPVTIQAATPGTAVVSGAVQYTGWHTYPANPAIFTNSWTNNFGACAPDPTGPPTPDIVLRREMVYINGIQVTQVLNVGQMQPGTFAVDDAGATIYVWPPAGLDPNTNDTEVATLPSLLTFTGKSNWVFRGLNFQYAAGCWDNPAVIIRGNATNITLDNDQFLWNNSIGLGLSSPLTYFTVSNSIANHNGQSGMGGTKTNYGLWSNDTTNFNNWRGAEGAYYTWNISGAHFFESHNDTLNGFYAHFNQSHGIHWDTDIANITASNLVSNSNLDNNIMFEVTEGPVTIQNSTACNSGPAAHLYSSHEANVLIRNSENITLTNNLFYNSSNAEVEVVGVPGGLPGINWETLQTYNLISSNLTMTGNTMFNSVGGSLFSDTSLSGTDWTALVSTLLSDNNTYWATAATPYIVPSPAVGTNDTFAQWQALTGQDPNSQFIQPADPSAACTTGLTSAPTSGHSSTAAPFTDYWMLSSAQGPLVTDVTGVASTGIEIVPINGYSGTVNLTVDTSSAPGITASLSQTSITSSGLTTLTLSRATGSAAGTYEVTVAATDGTISRVIQMYVTIANGGLIFSSAAVTFPPTTLYLNSGPVPITVTNASATDISIYSITTDNPSFLVQDTDCPALLPTGQNCNIDMIFNPQIVAGNLTGNLILTDSDGTGTVTLSLTGQGLSQPNLQLSPIALTFGGLDLTLTSSPMTSTLTNMSTQAMGAITSITVGGANPGDFVVTNNCPTQVTPGAYCTFTALFVPTASGLRTATVTIVDNKSGGVQTLTLSGTGIQPVPIAKLAPAILTFTSQDVTSTSPPQTAVLSSSATDPLAPLAISSIVLGGANPGDFIATNNCPASVPINTSCTFSIVFAPQAAGSRTATVTITDNATSITQVITMNGTGVVPVPLATFSSPIAFGNQDLTSSSTVQNITLTNTATDPLAVLTISGISITGTNPGDFTQTNTCPASLAIGATCNVCVTFSPQAAGLRMASVTVTDNAASTTQNITVQGTGVVPVPIAKLAPAILTFTSQDVTSTSPAQTAVLSSSATDPLAPLAISSIVLGGANPGDFSATNNCPASVPINTSCTVTVTFTPQAAGSRTATVTITDNATSITQVITMNGIGVVPLPLVAVSSPLAFGNQDLTSSSTVQNITVTNTATDPLAVLTISGISITGTNPGDFTQTNTCPASLAIGATCNICVTFSPQAVGFRSASVTLTDNAANSSQNITVQGTGVVPVPIAKLAPAILTFASQDVTTTSAAQVSVLSSSATDPLAPLAISSIVLGGANPGDFVATNNCPASLPINTACTITISFAPKAAGARTATVTITDNATSVTQVITVNGTGVVPLPIATLSATGLAFGNQDLTSTSAPQNVTLTNSATDPLAVLLLTNIAIGGTNPGDFKQTNTCPSSLAAGASCNLAISFAPLAILLRSATITLTDNASGGSQVINIMGTGIIPVPAVSLIPSSITFGSVAMGITSITKTSVLTNTSTDPLAILAIASIVNSGNTGDFAVSNNCPATLAIGQSCTFSQTFSPLATGLRSETITITDNAGSLVQTLSLSGTGTGATPTASLTPTKLTFGNVAQGLSSVKTTVLKNTSTNLLATLSVSNIAFTGTGAADYTQTNNCPSLLSPGASCTYTVTFTPTSATSLPASMVLTDNVALGSQTITFTGTGTVETITATLTPSTLAFGSVNEGTTSVKTTVLKNTSATNPLSNLAIGSITFTGTGAADYSQTNDCPTTLATGASCTITVTFNPTQAVSLPASMVIADNVAAGSQTLAITGTGTVPKATVTLTPASMTFPSTKVGQTAATQIATLTNTSTNPYAVLTITSLTFSGLNSTNYSQTNNCGSNLLPGASCAITVSFTPTAKGTRTATLNVNDNGTTTKQSITLSGTGS